MVETRPPAEVTDGAATPGQEWGVRSVRARPGTHCGEDELLRTIATGQRTVFVHPLQTLLGSRSPRPVNTAPPWTGSTVRARLALGGALEVGPGSARDS